MTEQNSQPGTAVEPRLPTPGQVMDLEQVHTLAKGLALAAVMPDSLRGKPWDIVAMVLYGQDLGLSPMQSIQGIYVVKGKPHISGQLWIALARKRGHNPFVACKHCTRPPERHAENGEHDYEPDHDATRCTFTVVRGDTGSRHTETFTIEDARTAKLLSNDNYTKYPKRMMLWRSATDTMRVICPEIALGFYTEGDDLTDDTSITVEQAQGEQEIADAEIVEPEKAAEAVAQLAEEFNFATTPQTDELPPPPADYACGACGTVGEHYEDECPKAATPR